MTTVPITAARQALDDTEAALARLRPALAAAYGIAGDNLTAAAGALDVAERAARRWEEAFNERVARHNDYRRRLAAIFAMPEKTTFNQLIDCAARTLTRNGERLLETQERLTAAEARADEAEAVTAETKRLMERRTTTLRTRAEQAEASRRRWKRRAKTPEQTLATVRQYLAAVHADDISPDVRHDLALILDGRPAEYAPLENQ
ncbi:hypothetical protein ACQZM9_21850 [Streptomyces sp. P11-1]|uniref:hypothetical protein n=1 Tax=Streptomyces sp. P11-1 TaxID=3423221 RepID=UPI003D2F2911